MANGIEEKDPFALPKEAQDLFRTQRSLLDQRLNRDKQARQRALKQRLSLTGLGTSGIAEKQARGVESDIAQERESALSQIRGQEQQFTLQHAEAERGRQFQAEEGAKNRQIQQQTVDLQRQLGLGYFDEKGEWIKGQLQIANEELDISISNQIVSAIDILKDTDLDDYQKMASTIEVLYGDKATEFLERLGIATGEEGSSAGAGIDAGTLTDRKGVIQAYMGNQISRDQASRRLNELGFSTFAADQMLRQAGG